MPHDTEENIFHGEVLPPDFIRGFAEFHAREAFNELARVYGRNQAERLWREIPEEDRTDESVS